MDAVRAVCGGLLILVFVGSAISNWAVPVRYVLFKEHSSTLPLVGGILGAIGFLLMPYGGISNLWWLPPVLDFGCVPWLLLIPIGLARGRR